MTIYEAASILENIITTNEYLLKNTEIENDFHEFVVEQQEALTIISEYLRLSLN